MTKLRRASALRASHALLWQILNTLLYKHNVHCPSPAGLVFFVTKMPSLFAVRRRIAVSVVLPSLYQSINQYRFIEVWQPKAGLHTDNQYIHAYNADRNKIEIGLLKIN